MAYYGKTVLAPCFINDLLTVLALGFIFSPFTWKTGAFFGGASVVFVVLSFITPRFFKRYGGRLSELEAKFLLLVLFGLGGLATWSGSEAVLPALAAAPLGFVALLLGNMVSKCIGVYPATKVFRAPMQEAIYTTLLMSTGLTFGTISSLFGLSHEVITRAQYSALVAAVVASAVVPTLIANAFFLPRHLLRTNGEFEPADTTAPADVAARRVS